MMLCKSLLCFFIQQLVSLEEGVCCDQCVILAKLCQPLPCFSLYSKIKVECYSRYLLTSSFCIPVPYNEKEIFFGCQFQKVLQVFLEPFNFSFCLILKNHKLIFIIVKKTTANYLSSVSENDVINIDFNLEKRNFSSAQPYCCSHTFWETNSLRRTMKIVKCSL